jgi:replicative superfamily II helicase
LEIIAIRLATSRDSLKEYIQRTLLSLTATPDAIHEHVESSLANLARMGFIHEDTTSDCRATQLGEAVVASTLEPEDGAFVHRELTRSLQAFSMDGEMHVFYTFTPVQDFAISVNWKVFRNEIESLDESGLRVMSFLGIKPTIINRM